MLHYSRLHLRSKLRLSEGVFILPSLTVQQCPIQPFFGMSMQPFLSFPLTNPSLIIIDDSAISSYRISKASIVPQVNIMRQRSAATIPTVAEAYLQH